MTQTDLAFMTVVSEECCCSVNKEQSHLVMERLQFPVVVLLRTILCRILKGDCSILEICDINFLPISDMICR